MWIPRDVSQPAPNCRRCSKVTRTLSRWCEDVPDHYLQKIAHFFLFVIRTPSQCDFGSTLKSFCATFCRSDCSVLSFFFCCLNSWFDQWARCHRQVGAATCRGRLCGNVVFAFFPSSRSCFPVDGCVQPVCQSSIKKLSFSSYV